MNTATATSCGACRKGSHFTRETEAKRVTKGDVVKGYGMSEDVTTASNGYTVILFESGESIVTAGYNRVPVYVARVHTH